MATHIFVFFPLCKLTILPTLRPCNFKSKSQSCLEKKISAKTVINPAWKSIGKAAIAICHPLCGVKSAVSCKSESSELLFGATSALCLCFIFLCWPYDWAVTKCNQDILLKSVSIWILPCSWEPLWGGGGGVNLKKYNKLFIVTKLCFQLAISLELIKINSYFFFFSFSCINMASLKMHKLNCCCKM